MTDDLRNVVRACLRHLVLEDIASPPARYAHSPLCVLDAVLAPRTRYEAAVRSVERYASLTGLAERAYCPAGDLPDEQQSLSEFIAYGRARGSAPWRGRSGIGA